MTIYNLWIEHCQIIYLKVADGIQIEEKVELLNELKVIKSLGNSDLLLVVF